MACATLRFADGDTGVLVPWTRGASVYRLAVGDSLTPGYATQLADHYGWTLNILSLGGDCVADQGNECFTLAPAPGDISVYWLGTNDKNLGADDSQKETNTASGHLASILQLAIKQNSNKVRGQSMSVIAGTWTNMTSVTDPFGRASSTNASILEATVAGPNVVFVGWWNSQQTGTFSITIDGVSQGSFNATPLGAKAPSEDISHGPFALTFTGLSSGSHTVRVTVTSTTNAANVVYVSFIAGCPGGSPTHGDPLVVVGNLHDYTAAGNTAQGITAGRNARYNAIIAANVATARALGLNAVLVDIDAVIGDGEIGPDGLHLNTSGYGKVKDAYLAAIDAA